MQKMRTVLHSDLNNFYASVEEIFHPEYENECFIVCGSIEDRHGIVLSKNEKAKALGIKTGMTIIEAQKICPGLIMCEAHFDRYLFYSKLVKKIYKKYSDEVESFGIDEAWIDVTHSKIFGNGKEIADKIRDEVRALGLTCSVGVSFNKVFAKLASDMKKPDATSVIPYERFKEIVWPMKAEEMLFIGKATKKKLEKYNIVTIGDLANCDLNFLTTNFGKWGKYIYDYANGLDESPVRKEESLIKSVGNSMTSYRNLKNLEDVKIMFSVLCESVSARLMDYGIGRASTLQITVKDEDLFSITRQKALRTPSVLAEDFFNCAVELFVENYKFEKDIRMLGVSVSNFTTGDQQVSLFEGEENYDKRVKLAKAVGDIRKKYGNKAVKKAIGLKDKKLLQEDPQTNHVIHPKGTI
ncbi:MAG: DNA polymerase thumb domain-containing protein [Christensenellaceae bacterium]